MLACFESVNCDEGVSAVGSKNMNYVNSLVLKELLIVCVNSSVGSTVVLLSLLSSFFDDVAECNHLYAGNLLKCRHMLTVCDTAAADNTDSYDV